MESIIPHVLQSRVMNAPMDRTVWFDSSSRDGAGVPQLPCGAAQESPAAEARGRKLLTPSESEG